MLQICGGGRSGRFPGATPAVPVKARGVRMMRNVVDHGKKSEIRGHWESLPGSPVGERIEVRRAPACTH